jgi:hypothetical protein
MHITFPNLKFVEKVGKPPNPKPHTYCAKRSCVELELT